MTFKKAAESVIELMSRISNVLDPMQFVLKIIHFGHFTLLTPLQNFQKMVILTLLEKVSFLHN